MTQERKGEKVRYVTGLNSTSKKKKSVMANGSGRTHILFSSEENLHFLLLTWLVTQLSRHIPNLFFFNDRNGNRNKKTPTYQEDN